MKTTRNILGFALAVILAFSIGLPASASNSADFIIKDGVLTDYTGPGGNVVIPADLGITEIGERAFSHNDTITSVVIPEGIKTIGRFAFYKNKNMKTFSLPNTLTTMRENSFSHCESLTHIVIPDGVSSLGEQAFSECYKLTEVSIPETVTYVGDWIFNNTNINKPIIVNYGKMLCYVPKNVINYTVPNTVTEIIGAFSRCYNLKTVMIPNSVTFIGNNAFNNCSYLSEIDLPDSVTDAGTRAFYMTGITEPIYVNNGMTLCYVPNDTSNFTIPESVTKIAGGAFCFCSNLSSIIIPDGVTYIGDAAFSHCYRLISIQVPDSVSFIGSSAFIYCEMLTSIVIPSKISTIKSNTFYYCESLTHIFIPGNVSSIERYAFYNCSALEYVEMQFGLTAISDQVFTECRNLRFVTLPDSLCFIDYCAFSNCSNLKTIEIPASVTTVSGTAFMNDWGLTILGVPGSFLEQYAINGGLNFQALNENNDAVPTSAAVLIDGQTVQFDAYNIGGYNYFKLRDIAMALRESLKQFGVVWDADNNAINLTSNRLYIPVGGELAVSANAVNAVALHTLSKVYLDERQIGFVAYNINGNNYFKLRDIAFFIDFGVVWDESTRTIKIDTTTGYSG